MTTITLKGEPISIAGKLPEIGAQATDFILVDNQLQNIGLEKFRGKKKLLNIVPSLDTPICGESARIFNHRAGQLTNVAVLVISADLPFAQQRFCSTEGVNSVTTLSMMRSKDFARNYGVLIESGPLAGLTTRAVIILDEQDQVIYTQLVPEITTEPDYEAAIAALNS